MIRKIKKKSKIMAISNKYKDILNHFINSLDIQFLDWLNFLNWPKQINQKSYNIFKSKNSLWIF